ncbi:MAG TPA: cation diffusion facilitator family transporter [Longimicrobiales bacterium]
MGAGHGHGHGHGHGWRGERDRKRLTIVLGLAAGYMVAEAIGGWLTGSLALLADAGHMLTDVAALGISLFAVWIAARPAPARRTYGYYRTEILAALVNGAVLVAVSVYIFIEAVRRLAAPPDVHGAPMLGIALGGLIVNLIGLRVLGGGHGESLNIRGAWLHVLMDTLGSVGAVAAGVLIWAFRWNWTDPVASMAIGVLVLHSSWRLLRETVAVLMEAAPGHIDVDEVREAITAIPGVISVHDLHIWTITSGLVSLSAHVVVRHRPRRGTLLQRIRTLAHDRFGIEHVTVQIEPEDFEERRSGI